MIGERTRNCFNDASLKERSFSPYEGPILAGLAAEARSYPSFDVPPGKRNWQPETGSRAILRTNFSQQESPVLLELRVENYAVIDHVVVEFAPGLNLLTGETGAGKSILIDALALLLGEKATSDIIRHGADKAVVSAVFEVDDRRAAQVLEQNGIDSDNCEIILRREIAGGGRGRVFVNNQPATVAVLKQLGPYLSTVHAQNETLAAFDGPARLALLDAFAGSQLTGVHDAFDAWKGIRARIEELEHVAHAHATEIEEHERKRPPIALRTTNLTLDPLLERAMIEETGQRIAGCL